MNLKQIIQSQYLASLEMLKEAITTCPDAMWDNPEDKNRFWHLAYHALFFTHLYLQPTEKDFLPWEKHQDQMQFMGQLSESPDEEPAAGEAYSKEALLEYLAVCQQQVVTLVPGLDLDSESGFYWLPFGKLELQFYNIRHLQHHTGELCERLGHRAQVDVKWVGMKHD